MTNSAEQRVIASERAAGEWSDVERVRQSPSERSRAVEAGPRGPFDVGWRAERERAQEEALPSGRAVVSCSTPLGVGGLGRHLQETLDALARRGAAGVCICDPSPRGDGEIGVSPLNRSRRAAGTGALFAAIAPLARRSPAWSAWAANVAFDLDAARRLPTAAAEHLIAFNGSALLQLRAARRARMQSLSLMSANSHLRRVVRMYALAHRQYPLERPWATRLLRRNLAEYALADRIYVSSAHAWGSFVEEGVPEERLALFPLTPAPRFVPDAGARGATSSFDIVYTGSLSGAKGVPLLIDAVRRLPHPDLRLVLAGGWGTRGMRRFVQRACAQDARIVVRPGDPLAHLQRAAVYVHPSYEDGFGYAPVEALACGVPAIVSANTGMRELIEPGRNGLVVPTGDLDALTQALDAAYRGEAFGG
ncbi:MAG: glycosyltransferase family 4 protein [Solirubrobacteraceae bacterium]|jgi:glycosyltransferase involved in cell wall biosynthesis